MQSHVEIAFTDEKKKQVALVLSAPSGDPSTAHLGTGDFRSDSHHLS